MAAEERIQGANAVNAGRLSPYYGEHSARYCFALAFVRGKRVLDIACGTGYGVAMIHKRAAEFVVGVDIDVEALVETGNRCGENAGVVMSDGTRLPFPNETFDVITSFETLEHLHEREIFLDELSRVLRGSGTLLLTTPNANYTQPVNGKPTNPFHVFEYTPGELRAALSHRFIVDRLLGQTLDASTGIPPFSDAQQRLTKDIMTQVRLFSWRVCNKLPFALREGLSDIIWGKPFYPTDMDYNFNEDTVDAAPTLLAVCRKG